MTRNRDLFLVTSSISVAIQAVRELHALSPPSAGRYTPLMVSIWPDTWFLKMSHAIASGPDPRGKKREGSGYARLPQFTIKGKKKKNKKKKVHVCTDYAYVHCTGGSLAALYR